MDFSKNLIPYLLFGLPLMVMMNGICPPLTSRLRLHTILDNPWISMPSRYGTSHQPWSTSHRFNLHAGTYQNTHFTPGIIIGPSGQIWQGPCTLFRRGWDPNPLMEIPNLLIEIPWIVRELKKNGKVQPCQLRQNSGFPHDFQVQRGQRRRQTVLHRWRC